MFSGRLITDSSIIGILDTFYPSFTGKLLLLANLTVTCRIDLVCIFDPQKKKFPQFLSFYTFFSCFQTILLLSGFLTLDSVYLDRLFTHIQSASSTFLSRSFSHRVLIFVGVLTNFAVSFILSYQKIFSKNYPLFTNCFLSVQF